MDYIVLVWALTIACIDWRQRRIPNLLLVLMLVPALLALIINHQGLLGVAWLDSVLGMVAGGVILLPGYLLGKMGAGDVKFAACLGLLLGWHATLVLMLLFALLLGAVSLMMFWRYRALPQAGKHRIAAAPVMVTGLACELLITRLSWNFLG